MKEEAKNELDKILTVYDEKLAETARREAAITAAREAFPERFTALKAKTIRPVLTELAEVLSARGHEATPREQEESTTTADGVSFAAIILRVVPKPFAHSPKGSTSFLEVTFSANRHDRKITVASTNTIPNSSGSRGKRGEYEIEAVTAEVVTRHVIQSLQEALTDSR